MTYGIVYELLCSKTGLRYVGQTVQSLEARWRGHIKAAEKGLEWKLPQAIREHGIDNFEKRVICECQTQNELNDAERKWIDELNTVWPNGYNMRNGAQYTHENTRHLMSLAKKGVPLSDEHKRRIGEGHRGKPSGMRGKHHSKESKRKTSEALKGRPKGPFTEEHRANLSRALKGRTPWNKGMKKGERHARGSRLSS